MKYDAVLEIDVDSRTGWIIRLVADRPIVKFDPARIKIRAGRFKLVRRDDKGFWFHNGLRPKDRAEAWCSWADIETRFHNAKVIYELTNRAIEDGLAALCDLTDVHDL